LLYFVGQLNLKVLEPCIIKNNGHRRNNQINAL